MLRSRSFTLKIHDEIVIIDSSYCSHNLGKLDEDNTMIISYDNLWKLLIDKRMNKSELAKKTKISTSTISKMTRGEPVAMTVLVRICDYLNCDIGDIVSVRRR